MTHDPLERLRADRSAAFEARDPNAGLCTFATATASGPALRTLVLREIDGTFAVFVNAGSPKARQVVEAGGRASVLCWLPSVQVQYRMAVLLTPMDSALIAVHWPLRPAENRWLDWAYQGLPQSSEVGSADDILAARTAAHQRLGDDPVTPPPEAIGLAFTFQHVERLHLAPPPALHDRRAWTRTEEGWHETLLVP